MDDSNMYDDKLEGVLHRRQAFRRKGYVFRKAQKLSKLCQDEDSNTCNSIEDLENLKDQSKSHVHLQGLRFWPNNTMLGKFFSQSTTALDQIGRMNKGKKSYGSSLDLAPSLLSIYDSIAQGQSQDVVDAGLPPSDHQEDQQEADANKENLGSSNASFSVNNGQSKCEKNSHDMDVKINDIQNPEDGRKRPLSLGSVSSASSSSSLPRHISKRPNLSQIEPLSAYPKTMEKLDHLLYIDDDATGATTDEEMSVDSEKVAIQEKQSSCQSIPSLSSESDNQDSNQSKCKSGEGDATPQDEEDQGLVMKGIAGVTPCTSPHGKSFVDNSSLVSSPSILGSPSANSSKYISHVQRVVAEIVDTEATYVSHLHGIIHGYVEFFQTLPNTQITLDERECLFGNIANIFDFSKKFLDELESCRENPIHVAQCFVQNNEGFGIYGDYCTNYPDAVCILTNIMRDPELSKVLKEKQLELGHSLPLGAYLLKPVQRVLKYHLLLNNLLKNYSKDDEGYPVVCKALEHMTGMAHHINEMKRKHEHAVRVQEIQSQLEEYDGEDLTRLGELVLEGSFRIYGAKSSRQVFLFEKGILITKKKEDNMLSCKAFIKCSNLMLVESIPKEPLSFQVIPFDNPRGQHMLQAKNLDVKRKWCQEIKQCIIESYKGKIPEKVKGLVLQLGKSKEEDLAKSGSALELKKFHHHNVTPEYLEKRQRLRRKSGQQSLTDLLKPQRKKAVKKTQKQGTLDDTSILSSSVHNEVYGSLDDSSISKTPSPAEKKKPVARSQSFSKAVKEKPLRSHDFEDDSVSDVSKKTASDKTNRSRSFRLATKQKPLSSADFTNENERISVSNPSTPTERVCREFDPENSVDVFDHRDSGIGSTMTVNSAGSTPNCSEIPSKLPYVHVGSEAFQSLYNPNTNKKVLETKKYFTLNRSNQDQNPLSRITSFKRDCGSPSAFHNSFSKHLDAAHLEPKSLTKPISLSSVLKGTNSVDHLTPRICDNHDEETNPWVRCRIPNQLSNRQRSHSTDNELDSCTRHKLDWLVYANRNSLPVMGYSSDDIPKLCRTCSTPPSSRSCVSQSTENMFHHSPKPHFKEMGPCRHSTGAADHGTKSPEFSETIKKFNDSVDILASMTSLDEKKEETKDILANLTARFKESPSFARKGHPLARSNSTPCARVGARFQHQHKVMPTVRSASVDMEKNIVDHEQIVAEMEEYLKASDPHLLASLSNNKFPTPCTQVTPVEDLDSKRDSCLSNTSSSNGSPTDDEANNNMLQAPENESPSQRSSGSYDNKIHPDSIVAGTEVHARTASGQNDKSRGITANDFQPKFHLDPEEDYYDIPADNFISTYTPQEPILNNYNGPVNTDDIKEDLQESDSVFSPPQTQNGSPDSSDVKGPTYQRNLSLVSASSFYEKRLSLVLDDVEEFRDSAVYFEMDQETPDSVSPACISPEPPKSDLSPSSPIRPPRLPIKEYVLKLEEQSKPKPVQVCKIPHRVPTELIRQRMMSLQSNSEFRNKNRSRPCSEERELPSFFERDMRYIDLSSKGDKSHIRSKSLGSTCQMSLSMGNLDNLKHEVDQSSIITGWVKSLVQKFQNPPS